MADFWLVLFLFIPNKYVGEVWRPEEVVLAHRFSQKFDLQMIVIRCDLCMIRLLCRAVRSDTKNSYDLKSTA